MGRYATALLLAAAPRPARAVWNCFPFWQGGPCTEILLIVGTLVLLGTSSCYFAHGCCSCATQDQDPKSQRRHRGCVQTCACTNAVVAIVFTAIFGLWLMGTGDWAYPVACLFFALAALAAVLGSFGADRRCKKGAADDADEPPVVSAAKDTA